ncbi:MAG: diguanylate cyclase domain-containing protein [Woeseia sp.]
MNLEIALSVLLCFSAVCYVLLGVRLIGGKREVGSKPVGITFIAIGAWVLGGAVELMATSYIVFSVGRMGHFVGTSLVPVTLLLCFREYTGYETSKSATAALLIVPVMSILVAATNYIHEFMWYLPARDAAGEFLTRPVRWGPWFVFLHAPYGYAVVGSSILTLVTHSTAVAPAHRRGLFLLAGSAVAPLLAVAAYDFGIGPNTISTLPMVFAALLPIYAWLVIGEQIIEFAPLAYETVYQNMQDPVVVVDDKERIIGLNHGAELMLNVSETDALRESLDAVFGEEIPEIHEALDTGKPQKMLTNTGRFLHLQVSPISARKAAVRSGRVLMFRDVSDVEKAQKEVRSSEKLLRTLVDHSVNGIIRMRWVTGHDGKSLRCIFANAAAGRYLNKDPQEIVDLTASGLMRLASSGMDRNDADDLVEQFVEAAVSGDVMDTEARVSADSTQKWLRIIGEPVGDDVAVTFVNITDRKAKEIQMESIAWSDPLTGVLNRRGFERDAAKRLSESDDNATGALLFIDLNEFKQINDRCGHEVGDHLLTIAARRLRTSLRSHDIIGRPGGDEFVALVPDVKPKVAEKLAVRLAKRLEEPYIVGPDSLYCAASIGLALYPEHANTLTGLLRAADQAMYRAKARCRGVSDISDTDLLERAG